MAFAPLLGLGLMAGGSILGGISSGRAAAYQAQVARNNAKIAGQNEAYSAAATSANVETAGLRARAQLGRVKTGIAANNLDVTTGSAADTIVSQRELGDLDVANTQARGAQQVYGYASQETSYQAQANLDQSQVGPDIAGGFLKAGGQLLASPSFDSATGISSLMSGPPSLPSNYQWMTNTVPEGTGLTNPQPDANGQTVNPLDL